MSANILIEPATEADLDELSELLGNYSLKKATFDPIKINNCAASG